MAVQKVHVIDDDSAIRCLIRDLVESVDIACETYSSAQSFLDEYKPEFRGCLVLDVRMAKISGLALQANLNELGSRLPIIFISGHGDVSMAVEALKAGALDFLQKPYPNQKLLDAINNALRVEEHEYQKSEKESVFNKSIKLLTTRERQVLDQLIESRSTKLIARELGISPRTVEIHRQRVLSKMGVSSAADLIRVVSQSR